MLCTHCSGTNLILWQNPPSESCSKAVGTPGLGLCLCRKMSVWDPSRGQGGSQPPNRNSTFSSLFLSPPSNINSSYLGIVQSVHLSLPRHRGCHILGGANIDLPVVTVGLFHEPISLSFCSEFQSNLGIL